MKFMVSRARATGVALLALALSACGGGEQVNQFQPTRVLAFGDEASVITDASFLPAGAGWKYTVNADPFDCASHPIWVQVLANAYGLVFPQCPGTALAPASRILAVAGAKVADMVTQVDDFIATEGFTTADLVTVLVGAYDIKEIYENGGSQADALSVGALVAAQVNRIANTGAKVIVSTVPELGLTPYGIGQGVIDPANSALLNSLTASFNLELLRTLTNDGRKIGLVEADRMVSSIVDAPASFGYVNWTQAACTVALPDCTTATLGVDTTTTGNAGQPASATTWLWASDLQLNVNAHLRLGSLANTRARNNPF